MSGGKQYVDAQKGCGIVEERASLRLLFKDLKRWHSFMNPMCNQETFKATSRRLVDRHLRGALKRKRPIKANVIKTHEPPSWNQKTQTRIKESNRKTVMGFKHEYNKYLQNKLD